MPRRIAIAAAAMTLLATSAAHAIAYGEPDEQGHPNTGAFVVEINGVKRSICSGALISPTVYLTAAHCTRAVEQRGITKVFVTFDSAFDRINGGFISGRMHTHPGYTGGSGSGGMAQPYDIAVITLDVPADHVYRSISPAPLPPAGFFDQLAAKNGLNGQLFTAVGYGVREAQIGSGDPDFPPTGQRSFAVSSFNALNNAWLRLQQNTHTGDGGTCYGDSGGPNFIGAGTTETPVIGGITVTGDTMCWATNVIYRLDTPEARAFLGQFVALP